MTKLLELAYEAVLQRPDQSQDRVARAIFHLIHGEDTPYPLSDDELEAIERSRRAIKRGDIATDDQVEAVLSKYSA